MIALAAQAPAPPDTSAYYHIAYTWAALLYGGYALILWRRSRRVRTRLAALRHTAAPARDI